MIRVENVRAMAAALDRPIRRKPAWLGMTTPGTAPLHGSGELAFAGAVFFALTTLAALSAFAARGERFDSWRTRRVYAGECHRSKAGRFRVVGDFCVQGLHLCQRRGSISSILALGKTR